MTPSPVPSHLSRPFQINKYIYGKSKLVCVWVCIHEVRTSRTTSSPSLHIPLFSVNKYIYGKSKLVCVTSPDLGDSLSRTRSIAASNRSLFTSPSSKWSRALDRTRSISKLALLSGVFFFIELGPAIVKTITLAPIQVYACQRRWSLGLRNY